MKRNVNFKAIWVGMLRKLVALPAAALHFDEALFTPMLAKRISRGFVIARMSGAIFQRVNLKIITAHTMHFERYNIPPETLTAIEECKAQGGRVIAVGTTTLSTLESYAQSQQLSGDTNIFITPGFDFKIVNLLNTNFHLPKSTLMTLVSAFAGYEHITALYRTAISKKYRFFSYGDSMLLKRKVSVGNFQSSSLA